LSPHFGQTTFFKPVSQPNPDFADRSANKRPLAASPYRPEAAGRQGYLDRQQTKLTRGARFPLLPYEFDPAFLQRTIGATLKFLSDEPLDLIRQSFTCALKKVMCDAAWIRLSEVHFDNNYPCN
jgi:hypothetical protein